MDANSSSKKGKLVLIIGPSGVGKSVILKRLRQMHPEFHFPKSATTRERRPAEGIDLYHFVSDEKFSEMENEGKFLETAVVHGVGRYGTLKEDIIPFIDQGKFVIREVDVQGFDSISHDELFIGEHPPYLLQSIFILPESTEQLIAHITKRAPMSDDEMKRRLQSMEKELQYADHCSAKVINYEGKIDDTIKEVETLILS